MVKSYYDNKNSPRVFNMRMTLGLNRDRTNKYLAR